MDCDNTTPEVLAHALKVVAQFGRVVLRRGDGNHTPLASKWQEALFDRRADTFCLVTRDSDYAYLCRKLRERGATVHIVGEAKSPDALRNASDPFPLGQYLKCTAPAFSPQTCGHSGLLEGC